MTPFEAILVALAGVLAGGINTVVGSGTLISFPVLLAVGYPPVVANVSNGLGLVPGSVSGAIGYRRELVGQTGRLVRFGAASAIGGVLGAVLLLVLPASAFEAIVPALIAVALVLVVLQPWLARRLAARPRERHPHGGLPLLLGIFATGVYGGYFGAAQGIVLLGLMGILMDEALQRINAIKNVLAAVANLTSGIVFVFVADVAWLAVLLLAAGSIVGGQFGARVGRRLPATWLRAIIVVVGLAAIAQLVLR
ncbi:MAG TPA: sulfite exporter TauE/SafE family protein [Actinophytocola sp.]|uniref:sulfite exporter TauE/SafE family protein n=1 Tax=Actinophytocola sp. TaxID=1872138 RepID=UPI002DBD5A5B|nr:sulfite exporter TauE/SafE family protein [Actinophytocola sp.]HEU5473292.1 sulfite exporter TauE/SafE family protein [Actinophytocola sp.]